MRGLSDERCTVLIKDRLGFMRFLRLSPADTLPDANTIATFADETDIGVVTHPTTVLEGVQLCHRRPEQRQSGPQP